MTEFRPTPQDGGDTNWRGKCDRIARVVAKDYQTRKDMWNALGEIRTILQTYQGFGAPRPREGGEPTFDFDYSTHLGQWQSWLTHDHLQLKLRLALLEKRVAEGGPQ